VTCEFVIEEYSRMGLRGKLRAFSVVFLSCSYINVRI
jgi:hypothetical protein